MSVLYISYDGMLEPLGQSQVLAYLKHLAIGRRIHLISFEKSEDWKNVLERDRIAMEIAASGIDWYPLRYHKWPSALATSWDIVNGTRLGIWLVLRHRLRIVHARSYVSSVMALVLKFLTGIKFLFDMRGFWADEKLDSGWISDGMMYKIAKGFERRFLLEADHVVSLTHSALKIIHQFPYLQDRAPPITVIPTCADLSRFKPLLHRGVREGLVIGYVGTAGNWYLFDQTAACFSMLIKMCPDTKFLIVNRGEHTYIKNQLAAAGVSLDSVELTDAAPAEMPSLIARMDASVFFIKPVFSKQASAATKLAELLGCGVPCLSNAGVGDMAEVLEGDCVGVALKAFDRASMLAGIEQLLELVSDPAITARCAAVAQKHFSLEEGVKSYRCIYEQLDNPSAK
jgi:glycosyltransferase involved in cell wall biosynthesis